MKIGYARISTALQPHRIANELAEKTTVKLRGKNPNPSRTQEKHPIELDRSGGHTTSELAADFDVAKSTAYRAVQHTGATA